MPEKPTFECFKCNSERRTEERLLYLCLPTSTTPNPTLNPMWLAAQWGRWRERVCVCVCVYVCVSECQCVSVSLRGFWCVIPEAPLTPSQVFPLSQTSFFLLFIFFLTAGFWTRVCFHIANHSIPQTWWNLCLRVIFSSFWHNFPYFCMSKEHYWCGCTKTGQVCDRRWNMAD